MDEKKQNILDKPVPSVPSKEVPLTKNEVKKHEEDSAHLLQEMNDILVKEGSGLEGNLSQGSAYWDLLKRYRLLQANPPTPTQPIVPTPPNIPTHTVTPHPTPHPSIPIASVSEPKKPA